MKIGIICEGEKTDGPVLRKLLEAEFPEITFDIVATTKSLIFSVVGAIVDQQIANGCERIVIVWDLHPVGAQMSVNSQTVHGEPCQLDQRRTLLAVAQKNFSSWPS